MAVLCVVARNRNFRTALDLPENGYYNKNLHALCMMRRVRHKSFGVLPYYVSSGTFIRNTRQASKLLRDKALKDARETCQFLPGFSAGQWRIRGDRGASFFLPLPTMKLLTLALSSLSVISQVLATNNFYGIVAANSIGESANYKCRTQKDWNDLATTAINHGFRSIRVVGFDCDALTLASNAAKASGLTIMAGIYVHGTMADSKKQIDDEVEMFIKAYKKYGDAQYVGLTIGNEVEDTTNNIMQKVYSVRGYLRTMGVWTPVSTVHTWVRIVNDPELCGADFVGANTHAFYDGNFVSKQTGDFVFKTAVPLLQKKCPGRKLYITESGWPSKGDKFGKQANASLADERLALLNLNCACRDDRTVTVYAFEADNQLWKHNDNERSFGIFGKLDLWPIFSVCPAFREEGESEETTVSEKTQEGVFVEQTPMFVPDRCGM
ncbi:glycoside hydrolase [Agrocybe pediades]|nr:glycoside hydrolase [Agrocybe pediades]